jgi:predicted transposase/invertase (TIGR01784 family)
MDLKTPHDSFVRSFFGRPEHLAPFLELCLPPEVFALLDTNRLVVHDGTYIDDEHQKHFSDISATVGLRSPDHDGQAVATDAQVYILVEHKSSNDPWALLQILRYMVQTWTRDSKAKGTKTLVPIIPILFYHGKQPKIRTKLDELFDSHLPPALRDYQPRFLCEVFNLTALPDSAIKGPPEQEAALWAMKYARTQTDLALRALDRLVETVGDALLKTPGFKDIELYLLASTEQTPEAIIDHINTIIRNHFLKEDIMSTAELLIQKGEARGKLEGKLEVAVRLKASGMPNEQIAALCGLSVEQVMEL